MRLSGRFSWTIVTLALPLAHCATSEDPSETARGGASTGGFGNTGTIAGSTAQPKAGSPSIPAGGSGGRPAAGGSAGATAGSGASAGKSVFGGSGTTNGGMGGSAGGSVGTAGMSSSGAPAGGSNGGSNAGSGAGGDVTVDHCTDGMTSGDETDEDCGGSCDPCALGKTCGVAADCAGKNCNANLCAASNHCAFGWRDDPCGQTCLTQTQSNTKRCADILDCYIENECDPSTCSDNDQKCGQNTLKVDAAPFPAAETVYECMCKA